MGLYKKGILGHFRGKIGTVVGAVINGIRYMRSLPDFGEDNPTEAQLNSRAKMSLIGKWLKYWKAQIRIGYQSFTNGTSPFSAAMGYHLRYAVTGVGPLYTIDYAKVKISVGELDKINSPEVAITTDGQIDIAWAANGSMFSGKPTDLVTFMVYNPEKAEFVYAKGAVARSILSYDLMVPAMFSGDTVYLWMSVVSADGKLVSESQYLGEWVIQ
ncbi:MAG TPA: DUF6266 family protein [Pedobacter sp.]|nr:DUF6266 family protein [Pedobacter sp.]